MKKIFFIIPALIAALTMMAQPPRHHEPQHGRGHGHAPAPVQQIYCATPEQLSITLQVIENQTMDDNKLEVAKLAVTLGHFCTSDLARIAKLFSFDDKRLTFLLYAHAYCEDPQNYPYLRDIFTFKSNYDELIHTLYPGLK